MRLQGMRAPTFVLMLGFASQAFGGPRTLSYQGSVLDAGGQPVADGTYPARFTLYDEESTGSVKWQEVESVAVVNGLFSTLLGDGTAFTTQFSYYWHLWLEVEIDIDGDGFEPDEIYAPRQHLAGAAWAVDADRLQGRRATDFQRRVTGAAPAGRYITAINEDGTVVTAADQVGSGDITGVTAGAGLSGGGTAGEVALSVLFGGTGASNAAARSDHTHLGPDILSPVATATLALAAQQVPWEGVTGVPAATGDVSGTYPALTVQGLQNRSVVATAPAVGQLLRWSGAAWEPATPTNHPPVAVLQADSTLLLVGDSTTLSLTLSYDPEGTSLAYAFEPFGRTAGGLPSFDDAVSTTVIYASPGDYLAEGWVRDAGGAFARAQAFVSVVRWEGSAIADPATTVGLDASLAVVDGHPAIAYYDSTGDDLKYVRSTDVLGRFWAPPVTVDSAGNVGGGASLAVVDGRPAIAYRDLNVGDLKYVRANDATGATWGSPVLVAAHTQGPLIDLSLAVVDGRPAISYHRNWNAWDLEYVRATDAAGTAWGTPVVVDSAGETGYDTSLAVVDGYPAIAYRQGSPALDLKYVRAVDAAGTAWGTPVTVDGAGDTGYSASLAVVDGRPAIAYLYQSSYDLKFVRASDTTGAAWETPLTPDSAGVLYWYASLAVVNGLPAVAYYDAGNGDLKFVRAGDAEGGTWGSPVTVVSEGDVGQYVSLAEVDGRAGIAYHDATNGDLRYTVLEP